MKQQSKIILSLAVILIASTILSHQYTYAWGFWAHKRINRVAVFTLPVEMIGFFKENIEYVTEHAIDPDKRRYAVDGEAPKHYIDIDYYCAFPHDCMPHNYEEAVKKFSEDTLLTYGTSPWNLEREYHYLKKAFATKDAKRILKRAADFGHYLGDIHVPLHTTINYNGQLTGQKGIHGFWESRIPELMGENYDYYIGKARYIEDINEEIWSIVMSSSAAVDSVLFYEQQLTDEYETDKKYSFEDRGEIFMKTYSSEFTKDYNYMIADMSHRRMRMTIISLGSFWYTAWVDAGSPDLSDLTSIEFTEEEIEEMEKLDKQFREGKIKGREHWD